MRFFIALEVPSLSRHQIEDVQDQLKQLFPQIVLTDQAKFHLTLAFIGEQSDSLKQPLAQVINQAVWEISPFEVTPSFIDGFPNLHHARTLWLGVKGDIDKLMIIRERIKDGLIKLHLQVDERRFVPHIAIAKTDHFSLNSDQELKLEQLSQNQFQPIEIDSIKLFESVPQRGFHQHNTLAQASLK